VGGSSKTESKVAASGSFDFSDQQKSAKISLRCVVMSSKIGSNIVGGGGLRTKALRKFDESLAQTKFSALIS
jgi:hypothetical protein